jgi:phosphoribulokinase
MARPATGITVEPMIPSQPNFKDIIAGSPVIFTIGVAGDSGSGKTTFTNAIRQIFGPELVSTITLDDYHTSDREERRRLGITLLNPDANNIRRLETDISALKKGQAIKKPVYNHSTGHFDPEVTFFPKKILILEGLHTLFTRRLEDLMDFSIFVDPDQRVKYEWKCRRDMEVRGYTREQVDEEIRIRERDYEAYIAPQKCKADAIIRISPSKYGSDGNNQSRNIYQVTLFQNRMDRAIAGAGLNIDLNSLLSFHDRDFLFEFSTKTVDCAMLRGLTLDGEMNYDTIRKLEVSIETQTGVHPIRIFENRDTVTPTDIVQLILSWRIIHKRIFMEDSGSSYAQCQKNYVPGFRDTTVVCDCPGNLSHQQKKKD